MFWANGDVLRWPTRPVGGSLPDQDTSGNDRQETVFLHMGSVECFESFARWEKSDTYSALRAAEATTAIAQLACPPAMSSVEHLKRPGESALWEPGWKSATAAEYFPRSRNFFKM